MKKMVTAGLGLCMASMLVFCQAQATRRFPVPGYGQFVLQVPEAWKDSLHQPPDNMPPTVFFTPASAAPFKVQLTVGTVTAAVVRSMDPDILRRMVESAAQNAAAKAVEDSLAVKELAGPELLGFYFSATDKAPKAGEYLFMTQGLARVKDMLLVFSIYTNDGQEAVVQAALEMLRGAVLQPGG